MPSLVAVFLLGTASPAQTLLDNLRLAVGGGSETRVASFFARKTDADYLFRMARNRGGLRTIKVAVVPTPPGWGDAPYWVVFHTRQDIESDHDPVYEAVRTMDGFQIGREVPEKLEGFNPVTHAKITAEIVPDGSHVNVVSSLELAGSQQKKASVFRLNDLYKVSTAQVGASSWPVVTANDQAIPEVKDGQILRAGGLLVPWTRESIKQVEFTYEGTVNAIGEDKITSERCYLTAWWVPSAGRLPFTTQVTIKAPSDWVVRSEGIALQERVTSRLAPAAGTLIGDPPPFARIREGFQVLREALLPRTTESQEGQNHQTVAYRCDVPISFPKIIGGKYLLAASLTDRGRQFRAYQYAPIDEARARKTVDLASKAVAWLEDHFAPFPFPGYDSFEAAGYYGIESYSHTLLEKSIVTRFISHEIGHTYFGGLVPCPYVEDSWNEGMTQYVDSVLYQNNSDKTLEAGLRSVKFKAPLAVMAEPHDWDGHSYMRGAYVMRMLEKEIGTPTIYAGLKALVTDRRGKDTTWRSLQDVFQKASGKDLDWFWKQWILGDTFPTLEITSWSVEEWNGKQQAKVNVRQSGTPQPYRLRFVVRVNNASFSKDQEVTMSSRQETFVVPIDFAANQAQLDVMGYALASFPSPTK